MKVSDFCSGYHSDELVTETQKLSELVKDAEHCTLVRDGSFDVFGLLSSQVPGKKVLGYIGGMKYVGELDNPYLSCVICTKEILDSVPEHIEGVVVADDPGCLFWTLYQKLKVPDVKTTIGKNCRISQLAHIAENNVCIGDNVVIEEMVSIKEGTVIGNDSVIRAGCIIGGEGFQVFTDESGKRRVVRHLGKAIIGENVEVQQSCCVDRAVFSWDATLVGDETMVDNLVHIPHGVKIGKRVTLTAGVIIAGNTIIGDDCWIGVNSAIRNCISIGSGVTVSMGSVVTRDIGDNGHVTGNFAIDHKKYLAHIKNISK